ncbi:MAG: DNA translocase FtsK [Victivallaceae bacterium]|nr:DNA translocase FtsK [Victivallaceae bacterium]
MSNISKTGKTIEPQNSEFKASHLFMLALMLVAMLAVISYSPNDAAAISGGIDMPPTNWIGSLGAYFAWGLFHLFGLAAYFLVVFAVLRSLRAILPGNQRPLLSMTGEALLLAGLVILFGLTPETFVDITDKLGLGRRGLPALALSGGVIGQVLSAPEMASLGLSDGVLRQLIGAVGAMILGWTLVSGGLIVIYCADWHAFAAALLRGATQAATVSDDDDDDDAAPEVETPDLPAAKEEEAPGGIFANAREALAVLRARHGAKTAPSRVAEPEPPEPPPETEPAPPVAAQPETPDVSANPANPPVAANAANAQRLTVRGNTLDTTVVARGEKASATPVRAEYTLPPLSMLSKGSDITGESPEAIARSKEILQHTLDSFKVPGYVSGYISGPRITRYEISLEEGVNVKKVEQIADNIAMALSAKTVRVLAPIPGRNVVGVEVPNTRAESVFMRAVVETDAWRSGKAMIPIVLGKDVAGKPVILDLAKAPHLLIAGATGSGKSVCMNTLIASLLFNFSPDELRLIMVDPKIVEFEDYKRLPHLITPVINESRKVPIALRWAVTEMDKRYRILARAGVKKLAEYNARPLGGEPVIDEDGNALPDRMPILIVIIDELAELMMTDDRKDVETYICRIAQLGRAAGVHIVVATQRPSTQIVTGVIKANLPTRIAFRVGQMVDSRVILDTNGAEKLLGMGDMLYMAPGGMELERVQGALIADADIRNVVKFVSDQREQSFNSDVVADTADVDDGDDDEADPEIENYDDQDRADIAPLMKKYLRPGDDDITRRSLEIVMLDHKVSTSYLQRRLKIGYNRAAEIVELLEERGIVGPPSGSGNKREILIFDELGIE